MDNHAGRQRPYPAVTIVVVLSLLCIIPGQLWMSTLLPGISGLVRIDPSVVFLDIPTPLPVTIDLILAPALFLLLYPVVILLYPSRPGIPSWKQAIGRMGTFLSGSFLLLLCLLSGGLIYYLAQDSLPRRVRNGIESFGINADIHLPYPGYETVRLRGSIILLVCFLIGLSIFIRKIRKTPGMKKVGRLTREQRMTPYQRMLREKRLQEKQISVAPTLKSPGITKQAAIQATAQAGRYDPRRLCRNHPVTSFQPEAVAYMPMP